MPRPPIKKTLVLAEAQRTGEHKADEKYYSKLFKSKKQTKIWLIKQFEKIVDKIDPLEICAILVATFFIKQGVEWTEDISVTILKKNSLIRSLIRSVPGFGFIFEVLTPSLTGEQVEQLKKAMDSPPVEITEYLLSFVVAYMIIKHPDMVIGLGGNILGVAKGLIGGIK